MKKIIALLMALILSVSLCACVEFGASLESISLSETNITLTVGDSRSLSVTTQPEGMDAGPLTWTSVNPAIARVENGTVIAASAGTTVVTATTEDGKSAACNVTVNDKEIESITLNQTTTSVKVDSRIQLKATVFPADAPTTSIRWSSSDDNIAAVNSEGYVTGLKAGTVNIICKAENGAEASCTVTVKAKNGTSSSTNNTNNQNGGTVIHHYYNSDYSSSGSIFPDSSSRKLSRSEVYSTLANMYGYSPSNSYAQDAINEIYARNGYVFKSTELRQYYESMPWYYPNPSFSTSNFSSIEKYNIGLFEEFD